MLLTSLGVRLLDGQITTAKEAREKTLVAQQQEHSNELARMSLEVRRLSEEERLHRLLEWTKVESGHLYTERDILRDIWHRERNVVQAISLALQLGGLIMWVLAFRWKPSKRALRCEEVVDRIGEQIDPQWRERPMTRALTLVRSGKVDEAYKLYRQETGVTWDEAFTAVETWREGDVLEEKLLLLKKVTAKEPSVAAQDAG